MMTMMFPRLNNNILLCWIVLLLFNQNSACWSFQPFSVPRSRHRFGATTHHSSSSSTSSSSDVVSTYQQQLIPVPRELEDIPIPFMDRDDTTSFIDCFADCTCTLLNNVTYTIGVPCDTPVALCMESSSGGELVPIDMDTDRMNDVFPMAEAIVAEEFGEDLSLQRTPQTLTLVGEMDEIIDDEEEEDEDDDQFIDGIETEDEDDDEEEEDDEEDDDAEHSVEVLLSFEHRDQEYHLVRFLDPVLILGRSDDQEKEDGIERRLLLTSQESKEVMPTLEQLFLAYTEQQSQGDDDDDYDEEEDEFADIGDFTAINP